MITQERLQEILDYNQETGDFVWKISMGTQAVVGQIAGSLSNGGYIRISIGGTSYPAHKLAWFYVHGKWTMVDHKDRRRWYNAIANLREANYQQNAANREVITSNSGVKGVYFRNGKYEAGIKVDGIRIYLGCYKTLEEAKNARHTAAKEYFDDFTNEQETQQLDRKVR